MTTLTKSQIETLQHQMQTRLHALELEIADHRDGATGKYEAAAVAAERDQVDVAFAASAAVVDRVQLARDVDELRDIQAAQARVASDSYGECMDCGGEVGYPRLRAWPTAKRCRDCQHVHERKLRCG